MRRPPTPVAALSAVLAVAIPSIASAAPIYLETFDVDNTAGWVVNKSTGANANDPGSSANFFFDYSTVGIPSAPNSVGGTTRGMRLSANRSGGIFSGLSASPLVSPLTGVVGDYVVKYDHWMNFNGPFPAGGSGSTQAGGAGIGTAGTSSQWAGGTQDSVHFSLTGDGNSSVDYRAYSSAAATGYVPASGVFAAGTGTSPDSRNNSHPYYTAPFPGTTAPAAQAALFPQQSGTTIVGGAGMRWLDGEIRVEAGKAKWSLNGTLIATVDLSTVTLGGNNILFNYFDTNATSTTENTPIGTTGISGGDLLFGIVDNVRIEAIPEPASLSLLALASLGTLTRRRRA
jgi:hypothetical protein